VTHEEQEDTGRSLLLSEDKITLSEEQLHELGFACAVGTGYYHNGVLTFTEERPASIVPKPQYRPAIILS
jgi:hypothetical protein